MAQGLNDDAADRVFLGGILRDRNHPFLKLYSVNTVFV
jgi:hypothetical protein